MNWAEIGVVGEHGPAIALKIFLERLIDIKTKEYSTPSVELGRVWGGMAHPQK